LSDFYQLFPVGRFQRFLCWRDHEIWRSSKSGVTISRLDARWTIQSDADGFRILVRGQPFAAIDALMQQVFGAPRVSVASDNEGHPHQVYGSADIGVAVQCIGHTNDVEIICARGPFVGGTK